MTRCERCGATLDPTVLACPYCKLTTPLGVASQQRDAAAAQAHAAWASASQQQAQEIERRRIQAIATQSLVWSIGGIVLCCLPLGVVGIVQGVRARGAAVAKTLPVPGLATAGLWIGIVSCVSSIALVIWAAISSERDQEQGKARIAELGKMIGTKPESPVLDRTVACQLAEARFLELGWHGERGYYIERFECPGKFSQTGEAAQLEDVRFHVRTKSEEYRAYVCFKRGARWYVDRLSDAACSAPEPAPSTTPSAAPSASSSPAPRTGATARPRHK